MKRDSTLADLKVDQRVNWWRSEAAISTAAPGR